MRVALLTDADVFAGTERHLLDLAIALRELPDAPEVLIVCPIPSPLAERAAAANVPVMAVPSSAGGVLNAATVKVLRRLLISHRIDLLHAHNGRMALHAVLARVLARRGLVVATQHFLAPAHTTRGGVKASLFRGVHQWMNRRVAHFIAISQAVAEAMTARGDTPPSKITTILNALPDPERKALKMPTAVRKEWGVSADTPLIVCAARLEREKNIDVLITALAKLHQGQTTFHCLIAGNGNERESLQAQIEQANLSGCVQLIGFRDDVFSLLNAGDLFVLPSEAEPFGLAVLEAMALQRAVVATNAGGPREIVVSGETGVLVAPGDTPALASALRKLLLDAELRNAYARAGRARYEERFKPPRMASAVSEVYRSVAAR